MKPPNKLDYPFHVFTKAEQLVDEDLTFSYHVLVTSTEDNTTYSAMCNDIPCQICEFSCKNGEDRQNILISYVKAHYPELEI